MWGPDCSIINTINDLINSGDKILKIEAVLSVHSTTSLIRSVLIFLSVKPFGEMKKALPEPDPCIDLSGKDVIRKISDLRAWGWLSFGTGGCGKVPVCNSAEYFEGPLMTLKRVSTLDANLKHNASCLKARRNIGFCSPFGNMAKVCWFAGSRCFSSVLRTGGKQQHHLTDNGKI